MTLVTLAPPSQDGNDFIIAFKTVEDADVPYIFERANIPFNKVLRVKASGHYRIVALSHGRSRIDFTATLNPTPASIIDNANHFKNEIWTFVQPLLRIRSDFDRSEEVDYAMCKDFVDREVENPVWLSNFEEEVSKTGFKRKHLQSEKSTNTPQPIPPKTRSS